MSTTAKDFLLGRRRQLAAKIASTRAAKKPIASRAPCKDLRAAMISRAILDAYSETKIEQHIRRSARQWLFNDDLTAVLSFLECCEALDLRPDHLRSVLRRNGTETARRGLLF